MEVDNFEEFWLHYLRQHGRTETRGLHILGTSAALVLVGAALASLAVKRHRRPLLLPALLLAAVFAGYGPAWIAHFFIEKNRPATFGYPVWSLLADLRMAWLWATRQLDHELRVANTPNNKQNAEC